MNRNFDKIFFSKYLLIFSFFQVAFSSGLERFQLKLNTKANQAFEQINRIVHERLENDQIKVNIHSYKWEFFFLCFLKIKSAKRHLKIANHLMSDEEKLRRRRERQVNIEKYLFRIYTFFCRLKHLENT